MFISHNSRFYKKKITIIIQKTTSINCTINGIIGIPPIRKGWQEYQFIVSQMNIEN